MTRVPEVRTWRGRADRAGRRVEVSIPRFVRPGTVGVTHHSVAGLVVPTEVRPENERIRSSSRKLSQDSTSIAS